MQNKKIHGYTLLRQLGRGGMAEVWYAENEIGNMAAVKILNEDLSHNAQIVERFRNEAIVTVKLKHPNIRQVYDYAALDDRPCMVMEYLEGADLSTRMKLGERFTDSQLRKWWNQLASALNYTHQHGVVHRDIKPSNIFINPEGDVKLLDFGIAKIQEGITMTQTGSMMGTLMYMSPEQVMDAKHIDHSTDLYSLAVTFVHLLQGHAPYDTSTTNDYEIRKNIVEFPLELGALPTDWQNFLRPYLAKKPANRPALTEFGYPASISPNIDETTMANERQPVQPAVSGQVSGGGEETVSDDSPHHHSATLASTVYNRTGAGNSEAPASRKHQKLLWAAIVSAAVVLLSLFLIRWWLGVVILGAVIALLVSLIPDKKKD